MTLFTVTCTTCTARLSVRDRDVIGQILECPRCGSMVEIVPPEGWQPPTDSAATSAEATEPPASTRPASKTPKATSPKATSPKAASSRAEPEAKPPAAKQTQTAPLDEMARAGIDLAAAAADIVGAYQRRAPTAGDDDKVEAPTRGERRSVGATSTNRRGYLSLAATGLVGLGLALAVMWAFSPPAPQVEETDNGTQSVSIADVTPPDPPAKTPEPPPDAKKQATVPTPSARFIDARWLPPHTQAVLSLRLAEVRRDTELMQLLERADPLWKDGIFALTRGLNLALQHVRRVTWAAADLRELSGQSLFIVELREEFSDSDIAPWLMDLEKTPCDFQLGDAPCYQRKKGPWTHPFALVEPRVLVTGPIALMRELAQAAAGAAQAAASVLDQFVPLIDVERQIVLLADWQALQAAKIALPTDWLAPHEGLQEEWRNAGSLIRGAACQIGIEAGLNIELNALCADEPAAEKAQASLEKLLGLLPAVLGPAAQTFLEHPDAAQLDEAVFTEALRALGQGKLNRANNVASVRFSIATETPRLVSTAWTTWRAWEFIHRQPALVEPLVAVDASGLELKLPEVEYRQAPLAGFVEDMSRLARLPITLDLDALAEAGLDQEIKVSVKAADATVAAVLRAALEPHALEYVLDYQGLHITTKARLRDEPRVVEYDVSDLARDAAVAALADLCRELVEPASWGGGGRRNRASLTVEGEKLRIWQSGTVHDDLLLFLEKLRVARGLPPQRLTGLKLESRFARVRSRLEQEVTANFSQPTRLSRIGDYLGQRAGVRVLIDGVALHRAGLDTAEGVTVTAEKEPLLAVLDKLCESLDIGWRIVDDKTLQVTSRAVADRGEIEFYPVTDLLGGGVTAETLAAQLQARVVPESWSAAGGQGVLHYDAASRHLIVLQSQAVQFRVEDYLATERAKKTAKEEPKGEKGKSDKGKPEKTE